MGIQNEVCHPSFLTMTFRQFQGSNIITTYEVINNTRGHLTVNSQSTQRQSLSDGEKDC